MVAPFGTADPPQEQGGKTVFNLTANLTPVLDFSLSSPTGTQTVNAGLSASYTITVSAVNGTFSNAVTLLCSAGVPLHASCRFNPTSVTPNATSANSTLTIATAARSAVPVVPGGQMPLPAPWVVLLALLLGAAALAALATRRRRWAVALPLGALLFLLAFQTVGCGGGGGGSSAPPSGGTAAGTYMVTVSGTSGTNTHTTTVTLKVN